MGLNPQPPTIRTLILTHISLVLFSQGSAETDTG